MPWGSKPTLLLLGPPLELCFWTGEIVHWNSVLYKSRSNEREYEQSQQHPYLEVHDKNVMRKKVIEQQKQKTKTKTYQFQFCCHQRQSVQIPLRMSHQRNTLGYEDWYSGQTPVASVNFLPPLPTGEGTPPRTSFAVSKLSAVIGIFVFT